MKLAIIIPAHNESAHILDCLDSFVVQTRRPDILIIVDDNSTDDTAAKVLPYQATHPWIKLLKHTSHEEHLPGAKVIRAFNYGLSDLESSYDLIGKFDADIILPKNYFELLLDEFKRNPRLGMCSGLMYIEVGNKWIYENISDKSHIRGPIKLYTRSCLESIDGLRESIGWDTVDELLVKYNGYETKTLEDLHVKHLRPTGKSYSDRSAHFQGEALYKIGYGGFLAVLAAAKMAWGRKNLRYLLACLQGYNQARKSNANLMVSPEEAQFIRQYRWRNIKAKLF